MVEKGVLGSVSAWQYTCMVVLLHEGLTVRCYDNSVSCVYMYADTSVQDARTPFFYIVLIIIY